MIILTWFEYISSRDSTVNIRVNITRSKQWNKALSGTLHEFIPRQSARLHQLGNIFVLTLLGMYSTLSSVITQQSTRLFF